MPISFALDWREFHVSRAARDKYQFPEALFASDGRALLADFPSAQRFAACINAQRDAQNGVRPSEIVALGLIDEILHSLIAQFRAQKSPQLFGRALQVLAASLGDSLDAALLRFVNRISAHRGLPGRNCAAQVLAGKHQRHAAPRNRAGRIADSVAFQCQSRRARFARIVRRRSAANSNRVSTNHRRTARIFRRRTELWAGRTKPLRAAASALRRSFTERATALDHAALGRIRAAQVLADVVARFGYGARRSQTAVFRPRPFAHSRLQARAFAQ